MNKKPKFFAVPILETRPAQSYSEVLVRIRLSTTDIWTKVSASHLAEDADVLFLMIRSEEPEYFIVAIPGDVLQGPRTFQVPFRELSAPMARL